MYARVCGRQFPSNAHGSNLSIIESNQTESDLNNASVSTAVQRPRVAAHHTDGFPSKYRCTERPSAPSLGKALAKA
jgi:hypothetical protein